MLNIASDTTAQNAMYVFWDEPIACIVTDYRVEYEFTNHDQCQEIEDPQRVLLGYAVLTKAAITDLLSYSTYIVYITPRNDAGVGITESTYNTTQAMGMYNVVNSSYSHLII